MGAVCRNKIEDLNLLVDNMLSSETRIELTEHIEKCNGCKSYYEDILALKSSMGELEVKIPDYLELQINKAVRDSRKKQTTIKRLYYISSVAAACIVLTIALFSSGGFGFWSGAKDSAESSEQILSKDMYGNEVELSSYVSDKQNENPTFESYNTDALFTIEEINERDINFGSVRSNTTVVGDYKYYTSAFIANDPVLANENGLKLDQDISSKHDVFYLSLQYTLDAIMDILTHEYEGEISGLQLDDSKYISFIQIKTSASILNDLEKRLVLIASDIIQDETELITVKISSTQTE